MNRAFWYNVCLAPEGLDGGNAPPAAPSAPSAPGSETSSSPQSSPPVGGSDGSSSTKPLASSDFDFNGFDSDDDDFFDFGSAAEGGSAPAVPEVVAPAPAAAPSPAPLAQQQPPSQQPASPPPPAQQSAPLSFSADPQGFLSKLSEHREALIDSIAQERFSFSEEEKLLLDSSPSEALPRMAARLYYDAVTSSLNRMVELVPAMIAQYNLASEHATKSQDQFFGKWPQLNPQTHMAEILRFGKLWRDANPQGTSEQFINEVGMLVAQKFGLGLNGSAPAPRATPIPGGFRPAIGQQGGMPAKVPSEDPWSGLGFDFD